MLSIHEELLREVAGRFERDPNVRAVFVSGSVARGEATPSSDIDVILIVKRPTPFVRFHKDTIHIEVDAVELEKIRERLNADPTSYYIFEEVKPVHDPENLLRDVHAILRSFKERYSTPHLVKGDLYFVLNDFRRKIQSLKDKSDNPGASFHSQLALGETIKGLYVINDVIPPPRNRMLRMSRELRITPPHFERLLRTILEGESETRISAVSELLDFLLPHLKPSLERFPEYYRPWEEEKV